MDLHVVPSGSGPLSAKASNYSDVAKTVAYLIGDVSLSCLSASHVVNVSSPARGDDDRILFHSPRSTSSDVAAKAGRVSSVAAGTVLLKAKSASDTRFKLLTNQQSTVTMPN